MERELIIHNHDTKFVWFTNIIHFRRLTEFKWALPTNIDRRYQTFIPLCVMASCYDLMELQFGVSDICQLHRQKQTQTKCIHDCLAHCVAVHVCLSWQSDSSWCRWHMHLTNQGYFDHKKTLHTPYDGRKMVPMSCISGLNLWPIFSPAYLVYITTSPGLFMHLKSIPCHGLNTCVY